MGAALMWWECTSCVAGGNDDGSKDRHIKETGHFVKVIYDTILEED